ncbi:hypothetical protein GCM10023323_16460 [Streptomyces thinghirensis]|uniref:CSD domain-containing protein n=3 Tax=Streptomyces TaxID=1883 RepID=A0ABP9T0V1_9ACTN
MYAGDQRIGQEQQRIRAALQSATHRDLVELDVHPAATANVFLDALTRFRPRVVHFSGHSTQGLIAFEKGEDGFHEKAFVSAGAFARAITAVDDKPLLVLLNSCHSAAQTGKLVDTVPFAIGTGPQTLEDDRRLRHPADQEVADLLTPGTIYLYPRIEYFRKQAQSFFTVTSGADSFNTSGAPQRATVMVSCSFGSRIPVLPVDLCADGSILAPVFPDGAIIAATRRPYSAGADALPRRRKDMASGTVKWFNAEKGFGFIEQDGGGADVFAHYSNIAAQGFRELLEGQKVNFDIAQGQKGPTAENIVLA